MFLPFSYVWMRKKQPDDGRLDQEFTAGRIVSAALEAPLQSLPARPAVLRPKPAAKLTVSKEKAKIVKSSHQEFIQLYFPRTRHYNHVKEILLKFISVVFSPSLLLLRRLLVHYWYKVLYKQTRSLFKTFD